MKAAVQGLTNLFEAAFADVSQATRDAIESGALLLFALAVTAVVLTSAL